MDNNTLEEYFNYHTPTPEQSNALFHIRVAALEFATVINEHVPDGADKTASIRKLRECVMTANQAIVLEGLI
jgi:hypothetical protein